MDPKDQKRVVLSLRDGHFPSGNKSDLLSDCDGRLLSPLYQVRPSTHSIIFNVFYYFFTSRYQIILYTYFLAHSAKGLALEGEI